MTLYTTSLVRSFSQFNKTINIKNKVQKYNIMRIIFNGFIHFINEFNPFYANYVSVVICYNPEIAMCTGQSSRKLMVFRDIKLMLTPVNVIDVFKHLRIFSLNPEKFTD